MKVWVNGEMKDLPEDKTVAELIGELDPGAGRGVAVAVDGEVVSRSAWETTSIQEGQKIEIVRAVQGG